MDDPASSELLGAVMRKGLLEWLRADAASADPHALPAFAVATLDAASFEHFFDPAALGAALRDLLARAALSQKAAALACTTKATRDALRASGEDLIGAAGAARWAQAVALSRVVRRLAECESLCGSAQVSARLVALCNAASDAADPAQLLQAAMIGMSFASPFIAAALEEESMGAELAPNAAAGWTKLADDVHELVQSLADMMADLPTTLAAFGVFVGGPLAAQGSTMMMAATADLEDEFHEAAVQRLLRVLRLPRDA